MNKIKRIVSVFLFALLTVTVNAQETVANPENADFMRSNGKLYVVVAVVVTILLGLFFMYLVWTGRLVRWRKIISN
jgi:hypothetical protein